MPTSSVPLSPKNFRRLPELLPKLFELVTIIPSGYIHVAITLSGGNVDSLVLMRILRHGLAAAERFLTLVVRAPDRPGSLARLLNEIQRMRANVVDVDHNRLDPSLGVDEVEIVVDVETRGPAHAAEVVAALSSAGFTLTSIE